MFDCYYVKIMKIVEATESRKRSNLTLWSKLMIKIVCDRSFTFSVLSQINPDVLKKNKKSHIQLLENPGMETLTLF